MVSYNELFFPGETVLLLVIKRQQTNAFIAMYNTCQSLVVLNRIQIIKMFKQADVPMGRKMLLIAATALHSAWRQPDRTQLSPANFEKNM